MSTPSIQTLITQAQQVLNLKSSNEIRATLAAVLANANVGTPLNPNLTTQQLWDEFYEIVRQPSDDIMSIITDQMMRMVFSPPAPGGAGADKQVIFNDGGVLAGDAGLVYNKTTDALTVAGLVTAGSATITGDLTVDTNTLFVNSTTNRVGIATASPAEKLTIDNTLGAGAIGLRVFANDQTTARMGVHNTNGQSWQFVAGYAGANNQGLSIFDATTSANRLYLDTSGNANIINGNLILGTSGKGIDFSATANSSGTMTSELLNDYEEGTFTPAVEGTTSSGTASYNSRAGRYTKVGKLVTVQVYIDWTAGTGTGFLCFSGLPFTIANNADEYASATIGYINNVALAASSVPCALGYPSRTRFELNQLLVGGGANAAVTYDAAGSIAFTATYFV